MAQIKTQNYIRVDEAKHNEYLRNRLLTNERFIRDDFRLYSLEMLRGIRRRRERNKVNIEQLLFILK